MDSFWSKLLILGIVAAIGLFFIANVYTPQRTAQEAMADSTQQSVNAVKTGVDETAASILSGESVANIIKDNCTATNTVKYIVQNLSGDVYEFTTSTTSGSTSYTTAVKSDSFYLREASVSTEPVKFTEQN
ncbi:MAG: hypothetical protein WBL93_07275 [Lutisporaceae bacterium]